MSEEKELIDEELDKVIGGENGDGNTKSCSHFYSGRCDLTITERNERGCSSNKNCPLN